MKRSAPPSASPRRSLTGILVVALLKLLWVALVVSTPLLGVWLSSSLSAYSNRPIGISIAAGLLLFPALPLLWDAWATYRRRKKGVTRPRILTFGDRFILRTLIINLAFLGVLLAKLPATAFAALSTRGDWMLDGHHDPQSDAVRKQLFRAADRLEWLYLAVQKNPFQSTGDDPPTPSASTSSTPSTPTAQASATPPPAPTQAPADKPSPNNGTTGSGSSPTQVEAPRPPGPPAWPLASSLHPAVVAMPAEAEASIQSVARYVVDHEPDPYLRVKALHDYVADRVAYDVPALLEGRYPPQDAETVFRTHLAVCAGYSRLFAALGKAAGVDILYVHGDARTKGDRETGESHAWNVVTLGEQAFLVDVTWDSGVKSGDRFEKMYRTDYLFTPPEIFGLGHFPADPRHQLRKDPISRGDFFRQPMMSPAFYAEGRKLISPDRSQVSVQGALDVAMENPRGLFTIADFVAAGSDGKGVDCEVSDGARATVRCRFPQPGSYVVRLFSNSERYGDYHYIGQVEANSGG